MNVGPTDILERHVALYLETLRQGNVQYEPEGPDTFPDFSLGNLIAVEATRLVKRLGGDGNAAFETQFPSVINTLQNAIESVVGNDTKAFRVKPESPGFSGNAHNIDVLRCVSPHPCLRYKAKRFNVSRFVDLEIELSIDARNAARALKEVLKGLDSEPLLEWGNLFVCSGLSIDVYLAGKSLETSYRLGGVSGPQFAGWVEADLLEQCADAIRRKEQKISLVQSKYSEFWLAVGSHLTTGLTDDTFDNFQEHFGITTDFNRLVLIDGNAPAKSRCILLRGTKK